MMRTALPNWCLVLAAAATFGVGVVHASAAEYVPSFQPSNLKGIGPGKSNEVLVLGTPHLAQMKPTVTPEILGPLLQRLEKWQPNMIAIENVSGLQCDSLRRHPTRYTAAVKSYCPDTSVAGRVTGLDVPAANAEAERIMATWPTSPVAIERRQLAAIFLAAGEPASALVQWLRLPLAERRDGDGLNSELVAELNRLQTGKGETTLIAVQLAVKLGLERVWAVDDHSADNPSPEDSAAYGAAIMKAWDNPATKARIDEEKRLEGNMSQEGGLMTMYRAYNAPTFPLSVYQSDFGAALAEPSTQGFGRGYVSYWETRNLRMVANIREVLGRKSGSRLLAIVGASHRGYYEAYLQQMHDVQLVDAASLLR